MGDLEKGTSAGAKEEEDCPLIFEEDQCNNNMNSSNTTTPTSSIATVSSRSCKKCNNWVKLFFVITGVALVALRVPVTKIRITISFANDDAAAAAAVAAEAKGSNGDVKAFQPAESTIDEETAQQPDPSTLAAPANNSSAQMHVDYHTNRFDYTSSWCPDGKCKGTALCFPCQRRWLIIVTVGRSASTTLTKMIALLPGVRMTGENNNLVGRFDNLLKQSPPDMVDGTGAAWFHNPIPKESWSCASQALFTAANPPKLVNGELLESDESTILGFKTIRLFHDSIQKHENQQLARVQVQGIAKEKVETLNRLFPCARFVVNVRSDLHGQVDAWEKEFGATNATKSAQVIETEIRLLHMFHQVMGPKRSFLLDSTAWTQNISIFNELVDWLGYSSDCHFQAALEYNTKDGFYATRTEADCSLSQECRYLY
jgi:hypothetical protein